MMGKGKVWVEVDTLPSCDLCGQTARYDAVIGTAVRAAWAFMCEGCFEAKGGSLGLGRGQRLVLPTEVNEALTKLS